MFFAATAKRRPIGSTECRLLAATSLAIFALAARDVSAQCSFHGLGGLPNGPANDLAEAYGVSADGRVVVGQARDPNNFPRAVRWTRDEGLVELFDPFIQYSGARAHPRTAGSLWVGINRPIRLSSSGFDGRHRTAGSGSGCRAPCPFPPTGTSW